MNKRRGYVVLIRHGDPEISGGIAEALLGAAEGKGTTSSDPASGRATFPQGGRLLETALPSEQVEVVEAEIDRQRIQRALLRVAVGNTKTDADYEIMRTKARGDYAVRPLRGIAGALLKAYAIVVLALSAAYRAQDRVLIAAGTSGGTTSSVTASPCHLPLKGKAFGRR